MINKNRLKNLVKRKIDNIFNEHDNCRQNILLFCTRRCGSTWLLEVLGSQTDAKVMGRPFHTSFDIPKYRKILSDIKVEINSNDPNRKITSISGIEEKEMKNFTKLILSGDVVINPPWRFWSKRFNKYTKYVVLQMTNEKALINWFDENFDVKIIYMLRHPIPNALSIMKRGWKTKSKKFIEDENFKDKYLNDRKIKKARKIIESGKDMEKHVLDWCLENTVPVSSDYDEKDWVVITYEQMVLEQDKTVNFLSDKLEIGDKTAMKKVYRKPSKTSSKKVESKIYDKEYLLKRWKKEVNESTINEIRKILNIFEVEEYSTSDFMPSQRLMF